MLVIANLWAKELEVGDRILGAEFVDSKFGPIKRFTVERPETSELAKLAANLAVIANSKGGA